MTCKMFTPGLGDLVDISAPELLILTPAIEPMSYTGSDFTMTGTVTDDIAVKNILVSWPGLEKEADISGTDWSITIPFSSITSIGPVVFAVIATDTSGKETVPAFRTVTIDNSAPTVLVSSPQVYNPGPENSNYIIIKGELWDSSPIEFIRVEIIDPASPGTPLITKIAEGVQSWSTRIDLDDSSSFINANKYLYRVIAKDVAGNINTYQYHSADFWSRLPDGNSFPIMTDIGNWDQYGVALSVFTEIDKTDMKIHHGITDLTLDFTYNSDKDKPQISLSNLNPELSVQENSIGQNVPIYASATDDKEGINRDTISLKITGSGVDLELDASEFNAPGDGLYTSFQFDLSGANSLASGQYNGVLSLADNKGVSSILNFGFLINKGIPSIVNLTPTSTFASVDSDGTINLNVEISDDNPGAIVTAIATDEDGTNLPGTVTLVDEYEETVNSEIVYRRSYNVKIDDPVIKDKVIVQIVATDSSSLINSRTVEYDIDRNEPDIVISVPSPDDNISGTALTVVGTSVDVGSNIFNVQLFLSEGQNINPPVDATWLDAEGNTTWSLPVDLSSFSEGRFTIFAKAFDVAGNEGDFESVYFDYDMANPTISLDNGTTKEYVTSNFELDGSLSDTNGLGVLTIQSAKDGGAFLNVPGFPDTYSSKVDTWSLDVSVNPDGTDDGIYEYEFTISDVAGKTETLSKTVVIDTTAPDLIVSNLANGDSVNSTSYTIIGLASDLSGILDKEIEYKINSEAWGIIAVERTGNWELPVSGLAEGANNSIAFKATDIVGNESDTITINFGLDLNPPTLTIAEKAALNGTFTGTDIDLSGITSDINGIDHMEISTDGGLNYNTLGAYSSSDSSDLAWNTTITVPAGGTEDGNHIIRVKSVDNYNKETIESFSITYDTTPPDLLISNLTDGDSVESSTYTIKGTATDISGILEVEYNLNTDPISGTWLPASGTNSWSQSVSGLSEGSGNYIAFRATDNAGHSTTSAPINFRLDLSPPTLIIDNKDTYNNTWQKDSFTLSGTSTDANGIDTIEISTDGGSSYTNISGFTSGVDNWIADVTIPNDGSKDGNHVIRVKSIDTYNKETIDSLTVKYDTTAPTFVLTNLVDNQLITNTSFTALGSWSDNGGSGTMGGLSKVEYRINSGSWTPINTVASASIFAHNFTFTEISDQALDQTISFKASDVLGNESAEMAMTGIDIDLALPVLTEDIINSEDTYYESNTVEMNGSVYDTLGLSSFTVSVNGGAVQPITPVGNSWSYDQSSSTEGYFELVFTAADDVNRTSSITRNIIIDTSAPIIEFYGVFPVVGSNTVNSTIDWKGSISEENISTLQYLLPGETLTDLKDLTITNNKWEVIGLDTTSAIFTEDTVNNLRIIATDKAGLTTDLNYPIYVDQDSDYPAFTYTNVDSDNDTIGEAGLNLLETGAKIIGSISDDDGVNKDTIEVQIYNNLDIVHTPWAAISGPPLSSGTLVNWSQDLSGLSDGVYSAEFRTEDINGLLETTDKVYFAIDLQPAALNIAFPNSGSYHKTGFSISGTASDVNGLLFGDHDSNAGTAETEYIKYSDDGGSTWNNIPVDGSGNWTHPITAPADNSNDGVKNYQVKATDIFNKSTTNSLNFTIDTIAPNFTIDSSTADIWTLVNYLSINGTSSDSNGVVSVRISLDNTNWTTVNGTVAWNNLLDIGSLAEQENKTIYFEYADIAGNVTYDSININIDRTAPVIVENTYASSAPVYEISDYTLSGTLTENLINSLMKYDDPDDGSADMVEYIEIIVNSGATEKIPVSIADTWTYPVTFSAGTFEYKLQVTDKAGNISIPLSRTVIADNEAPSVNNINSPTGMEQFISGSAYSLSGTATDTGVAGIDKVYRVITEKSVAYPGDPFSGDFTGWTVANGLDNWTDSLDISDTGTGEGDKTLHVFTVDKAGNVSTVIPRDFTIDQASPLISNVIITPDGDAALSSNNISLNKDFVISGTVTETNGFEYFEMKIGTGAWNTLAITDADSDKTYDWSYSVDLEDGNGSDTVPDGSYEYQFRARDLAGRDSIIVQKNVYADTEAPSVSYINLDSASIVNGVIFNVKGTTADTSSTISSVTIAVKGPGDTDYGSEQAVVGSEYSWNFDLDLKPSGSYYDDTNPVDTTDVISLRVTAEDSVGNIKEEFLDFNIDQEDDKPSLSLSNVIPFIQPVSTITISDSTSIFTGVLFDPVGVDLDTLLIEVNSVPQVPVLISGVDNDTSITWFVDLSDIAGSTAAPFSYSITALNSSAAPVSGNYSGVVNRNIDVLGAGAKITGSAEDDDAFDSSTFSLLQNGIDFSASSDINIGSNSTYVPWSYTLPSADDLYYLEMNGTDASIAAIPVDWAIYSGESLKTMVIKDSSDPIVTITSPNQGAYVNGSIVTSGEAYDDLAINSLTITAVQSDNSTSVDLTSDAGVALDKTETTGEYYYDTIAGKYVWNFLLERLPDAYENDSITLVYEAIDIVGNITTKERSITIDTVDPIINVVSPVDGGLVNGEIVIQGTVTDAKLSLVEMKIGNSGSYFDLTGTYNWSHTINSSSYISDANVVGDGTYELPVTIRATDQASNQTELTTYSFLIDPDGDKPIISFSSPTTGSTLGGEILLIGTASDDDGVSTVEIRVDFNGDGDFNDIVDINDDGDTVDEFETESSWVTISDFSNGSWKKNINTSTEQLYSSVINANYDSSPLTETMENAANGLITIEARAIDIYGTESRTTALSEVQITLDESFPKINYFRINGEPDTVSDSITIEWDIEDTEGITNVAISYDGGLTYPEVIYDSTAKASEIGSIVKNTITDLGFSNTSDILKIRLKAMDETPYVSFSNITVNVDNVYPTGVYTGHVEDIGDAGEIWFSGTVSDSGFVSGIDKIEVYLIQNGDILEPEGTGTLTAVNQDFGDGNGLVPYTTNPAYKIIVDQHEEFGGTQIDNDGDGYIELMNLNGSNINWQAQVDTSSISVAVNPVELHYVVFDTAGNRTHYVETMMMVGTDLDNSFSVEPGEMVAYPQGFKARNLLKVETEVGTNNYRLFVEHNSSGETDLDGNANDASFLVDISGYTEGDTTFTIEVQDMDNGNTVVLSKTLNVTIIGDDLTAPIMILNPLTLASMIDGHLETSSIYDGADYDLSGETSFSGTVTDNTRIKTIHMIVEDSSNTELSNVLIGSWNSGVFEPSGGASFSTNNLDWENGHVVDFTIDWDSSTMTGIVGQDTEIRFEAIDFKDLNSEANAETDGNMQVDIVPYITNINTSLSTAYLSNPTVFSRTSLGSYPVYENEQIEVEGFNLNGTSTLVSVGGSSTNIVVSDTTPIDSKNRILINIGATVTSGDLELGVNGIPSINNINDNSDSGNLEGNGLNNNLLTDNRTLEIWDFTLIANTSTARYPIMKISDDGKIGFSYADGESNISVNDGGTKRVLESSYTRYNYTTMNYDDDGNYYAIGLNSDRVSDTNSSRAVFFSRNYNANTWHYNTSNGKRQFEHNYNGSIFNSLRTQNPDLEITGDGSSANLYMSYYDDTQKTVKFRYFTVGANQNTITGAMNNWNTSNNWSANGFHTVAGNTESGPYSSVGVTSTGEAVVAWYDATNRSLKFAYNDDPTNSTDWSNKITIDSYFAGKYIDVTVDAANGIHLAYYSSSAGDLKYAYLSSFDDTTPDIYTVDTFLSVGQNITIQTQEEAGVQVPYISYYVGSYSGTQMSIRYAKWNKNVTIGDGAILDKYTGKWNISSIPARNIPKNYTVSTGIQNGNLVVGYATDAGIEYATEK